MKYNTHQSLNISIQKGILYAIPTQWFFKNYPFLLNTTQFQPTPLNTIHIRSKFFIRDNFIIDFQQQIIQQLNSKLRNPIQKALFSCPLKSNIKYKVDFIFINLKQWNKIKERKLEGISIQSDYPLIFYALNYDEKVIQNYEVLATQISQGQILNVLNNSKQIVLYLDLENPISMILYGPEILSVKNFLKYSLELFELDFNDISQIYLSENKQILDFENLDLTISQLFDISNIIELKFNKKKKIKQLKIGIENIQEDNNSMEMNLSNSRIQETKQNKTLSTGASTPISCFNIDFQNSNFYKEVIQEMREMAQQSLYSPRIFIYSEQQEQDVISKILKQIDSQLQKIKKDLRLKKDKQQ